MPRRRLCRRLTLIQKEDPSVENELEPIPKTVAKKYHPRRYRLTTNLQCDKLSKRSSDGWFVCRPRPRLDL